MTRVIYRVCNIFIILEVSLSYSINSSNICIVSSFYLVSLQFIEQDLFCSFLTVLVRRTHGSSTKIANRVSFLRLIKTHHSNVFEVDSENRGIFTFLYFSVLFFPFFLLVM